MNCSKEVWDFFCSSIELWGVELIKSIPEETLEKFYRYLEDHIDDYIEDDGGY